MTVRGGDKSEHAFDGELLLYKFNKHLNKKVKPCTMLVEDSDVPAYLTKDRISPSVRMRAGDFFAKNAVNNIECIQDYYK